MDFIQYIGLLGSFLGCFGYLLYRIDSFESKFQHMENKMDVRDQRIDNLYQMFVDLLKEGRK